MTTAPVRVVPVTRVSSGQVIPTEEDTETIMHPFTRLRPPLLGSSLMVDPPPRSTLAGLILRFTIVVVATVVLNVTATFAI